MTATAREHFEAGNLHDAIQAMNIEVRDHPTDQSRRGFLAELLCFTGNIERADLQLDTMMKQDTAAAVGIVLFRQLVRAEQARRQFFAEGRLPEFLDAPPSHLTLHLEASILLREGKPSEAAAKLAEAEAVRPRVAGRLDGRPFEDMRDIDDLTSAFFEVLTSNGKYYWIPMERVESVEFHAPERARDLIWRRTHMIVAGGPDGEVFLPAIYVPPIPQVDDRVQLGRVTDWIGGDGTPVRGIGQRSFLIGDDSVPILDLKSIEFDRPEG